MYDVIVIGAGPCGLSISKELLNNNLDVLLLEEHKEVGIPRHCTGVVSSSMIKLVGNAAERSIINKIKRAKFVSPHGYSFDIYFDEYVTFILDRILFEQLLLKDVEEKGASILFNKRVNKIDIQKDKVNVFTNNECFISKFVVCASGPTTNIVEEYHPPFSFPSIQYEIEGNIEEQDKVDLVFVKEAKNFFLWQAPTSNSTFLIGLGNKKENPKKSLDKYLSRNKITGKIRAIYSGRIIYDYPVRDPIIRNRVIVIGDAAGHSKSTTGGGLFYGILSSKIAGKYISEYLTTGNDNYLLELKNVQEKYINKELRNTHRCAEIFYNLPLAYYDLIFKKLSTINFKDLLNPEDQDHHIWAILKMFKNPSVIFRIIKDLFMQQ